MQFKHLFMAAALVSVASTSALAGDADFTLVNRTGYEIREVYISAAHRNNWGNDRLGDGSLVHTKAKLFKFSDRASCKQDIMVVFEDDSSKVTWEDVDLCEINKLTQNNTRPTKSVSPEVEGGPWAGEGGGGRPPPIIGVSQRKQEIPHSMAQYVYTMNRVGKI